MYTMVPPLSPPRWWVLGLGFAPPRPRWCGWWGLGSRCIDMNGFRVEGQQSAAGRSADRNRGPSRRVSPHWARHEVA